MPDQTSRLAPPITGELIPSLASGRIPRGAVKIVNRKKLEGSACECYGVIQQYDGELGLK